MGRKTEETKKWAAEIFAAIESKPEPYRQLARYVFFRSASSLYSPLQHLYDEGVFIAAGEQRLSRRLTLMGTFCSLPLPSDEEVEEWKARQTRPDPPNGGYEGHTRAWMMASNLDTRGIELAEFAPYSRGDGSAFESPIRRERWG